MNSTASCTAPAHAAHRRRRRRRQPARAVIAAPHRRQELTTAVLGLLPLGTGNDFARGTDLPLDPVAAAEVVLRDNPRPMDLVVDEVGEVVVNGVHVGVGAGQPARGRPEEAVRADRLPDRRRVDRVIDPPTVRRCASRVDGSPARDLDERC